MSRCVIPGHESMLPPGNWELLSIDPSSDTYTYFDYDEATDETRTFTLQPSQLDILDDNKRFVSMDDKGYKKDKDFWCAATIPNSIIHKWLVEDGVNVYDDNDWPAVKRKLNSNEYRYLRRGHFNI